MNINKSKALRKREAKEAESVARFKATEKVPEVLTKAQDEERQYLAYLEGRSDPRD